MRLFKKSLLHQNNMFSSTTDDFHMDSSLQFQKSYSRADTMAHAMHLFEEKNKYSATPVVGPLPIKANGAIVVNRPQNKSKNGTVRSLPIYLQDVPFQEEIEEEQTIKKVEKSTEPVIKEETEMTDLVHQENMRLRQQVLLEREQYEKWRIEKEMSEQELKLAQQTMKNMQRVIDRFQKIVLPSESNVNTGNYRRQSTGVTFSYINGNQSHVVESYERKIQILLNEMDAMEIQEIEIFKRCTDQKKEFDNLKRELKHKDDLIRQLFYDLKYEQTRQL